MKRVLAADDSATIRQMLVTILTEAGFDVTLAADGNEALERASTDPFDLVLTDVNMPGIDGISLVRALRRFEAYRYVPIIVITTESSLEFRTLGRDAGATGWIVKPFNPARLVETVQRVLV